DRIPPCKHIFFVAPFEFLEGFLFAVKQLHDTHARDVFLQEGIDSCDSCTNTTICVANVLAKNQSNHKYSGKDRKGIKPKTPIQYEKPNCKSSEQEKVVDHCHNACSK